MTNEYSEQSERWKAGKLNEAVSLSMRSAGMD